MNAQSEEDRLRSALRDAFDGPASTGFNGRLDRLLHQPADRPAASPRSRRMAPWIGVAASVVLIASTVTMLTSTPFLSTSHVAPATVSTSAQLPGIAGQSEAAAPPLVRSSVSKASSAGSPPQVSTGSDRAPKPCPASVDPDAAAKKSSMMAHPDTTSTVDPANDAAVFAAQEKEKLRLLGLDPDLSKLCAQELAASWAPAATNVSAAISGARIVVWGRLTNVATPDGQVVATVTVLKARPSDGAGHTLTVHLSYGIGLGDRADALVVTPRPGSPVLTAGDEAIFLLIHGRSGWASVPGGELPVDDGRIDSSARAFQGSMGSQRSDFGHEVDGLTPSEFFSQFAK